MDPRLEVEPLCELGWDFFRGRCLQKKIIFPLGTKSLKHAVVQLLLRACTVFSNEQTHPLFLFPNSESSESSLNSESESSPVALPRRLKNGGFFKLQNIYFLWELMQNQGDTSSSSSSWPSPWRSSACSSPSRRRRRDRR